MKRLPSKMTTEELAVYVGVAKQTVNRWVRKYGWKTEKMPGVKGGKARLITIDPLVRGYVMNLPAMRMKQTIYQLAETPSSYTASTPSPLLPQIIHSLESMTQAEQQRLLKLLTREGLHGFLTRLDIAEPQA